MIEYGYCLEREKGETYEHLRRRALEHFAGCAEKTPELQGRKPELISSNAAQRLAWYVRIEESA